MPFNPEYPNGYDCIYCADTQLPSAVDLLREPTYAFVKEVREGQIDLADSITQGIMQDGASAFEAGTGIGKSYAYLLPAILSGRRVVVSTAKIALQTQLMEKDLPHIKKELQRLKHPRADFKFFPAYGKSNFACDVLYMKEKEKDAFALKTYKLFVQQTKYQRFDEWDSKKGYIDRSLNATACVGPGCPLYKTCGYTRAKRETFEADVVVTNHWMLGYDLRLRKNSQFATQLLGDYDHIIVDEAHKVEDGIRAAFTLETKLDTIDKLQKQIAKLTSVTQDDLQIPELDSLEPFWEHAFNALATAKRNQDQTLPANVVSMLQNVSQQLTNIRNVAADPGYISRVFPHASTANDVHQYVDVKYNKNTTVNSTGVAAQGQPSFSISNEYQRRFLDFDKFFRTLEEAQDTFNYVIEGDPYRLWLYEPRSENRPIPALKSIPITIGHYMPKHGITYLSATLALGPSFDTFLGRVGLLGHPYQALIFPSPFDIQKQAFLYIPKPGHAPGLVPVPDNRQGPGRDLYQKAVAEQILALLTASEGDAFVLFTANSELTYVKDYLRDHNYPFPVFAQGEYKPAEALQRFRSTDKATILGVKSFWEGVDVQGAKLFLVIVAKLPFPNTSDPIYQARCALVNARNPGASERVIRVPDMLFDLRQGVGRLIRAKSDRGVIALLDSRAHLQYRNAVRDALNLREHFDLEKMCRAIRTRHNKKEDKNE